MKRDIKGGIKTVSLQHLAKRKMVNRQRTIHKTPQGKLHTPAKKKVWNQVLMWQQFLLN